MAGKECPSCKKALNGKNEYCNMCGWYDGENGKGSYEKDKKQFVEELNSESRKLSIDLIRLNTRILHFITDAEIDFLEDIYKKYIEEELFNHKFITMHCVFILKKSTDSVSSIIAFKQRNNERILYNTISFTDYKDEIMVGIPYFAIGHSTKRDIFIVYPAEAIEDQSEFLFNEMQFNYSGRLYLHSLYNENRIKKPKYFIALRQ